MSAGHADLDEARVELNRRCNAIEECYEYMLAYAWQGLAGEAMGGEVLVSSLVRDLVGTDTFVEGPEVELKGLEGRHRLYALAPA